MAENDELSPRQLTAIASLLQHGTVSAAAQSADVPERTFYTVTFVQLTVNSA
jgi:hypothetical protein